MVVKSGEDYWANPIFQIPLYCMSMSSCVLYPKSIRVLHSVFQFRH